MKNFFLAGISLLFLGAGSFAQNISWPEQAGADFKANGTLRKLVAADKNELVVMRGGEGNRTLSRFDKDLTLVETFPLFDKDYFKNRSLPKPGKIYGTYSSGSKTTLFYSTEIKKVLTFYAVQMDASQHFTGDPVPIMRWAQDGIGMYFNTSYHARLSADKNYLICHLQKGHNFTPKEDPLSYDYVIYDLSEGIPYGINYKGEAPVTDIFIAGETAYILNDNNVVETYDYQRNEPTGKTFKIKNNSNGSGMLVTDHKIIVSGLKKGGRFFYTSVDLASGNEEINQEYDMDERMLKELEEDRSEQRSFIEISDVAHKTPPLIFREIVSYGDGSLTLISEQYNHFVRHTTSSKGTMTEFHYYDSEDIVMAHFDAAGAMKWTLKIPKRIGTRSDVHGGYVLARKGDKLHLFFNDHEDNPTTNSGASTQIVTDRNLDKSRIVMVTVDKGGNTKKEAVGKYEAKHLFLAPFLSKQIDGTNEVFMAVFGFGTYGRSPDDIGLYTLPD